jgi:ribosome biogenesis GTPase A
MAIHWFPGHMHKAQKQIREIMPMVDIIIEVLDARLPYSSENPLIAEIRADKPVIKVLNKADLADPEVTERWRQHLEQQQGIRTLAITTKDIAACKEIPKIVREMVPHKGHTATKPINTMIAGIPNVGKSTLINILAERTIAKTGNEPAVTKAQQRINLRDGVVLYDTPGILWPKIENPNSGYRLAMTGAIKDTAMEYEDVALYACEYLLNNYPNEMVERYKLDEIPGSDIELLEAIGAKRGAKQAGGRINLHKASEVLLHELRSAALGRITVERPELIAGEIIAVDAEIQRKADVKAARLEKANRGKRSPKKK